MTFGFSKSTPDTDLTTDLIVAEYQTVRDEAVASFQSAQSIIQWSLATYGVLFGAAALALTGPTSGTLVPVVGLLAIFIFGLLLPGLVCAASWQWLAEITRMERTGVYVRGLEAALRRYPRTRGITAIRGPLGWETFLAGTARTQKRNAPYIGTAAMYFGAMGTSLGAAWFAEDHYYVHAGETPLVFIWRIVGFLLLAAFLAISFWLGAEVVKYGRTTLDFETGNLVVKPSRKRTPKP